MNICALKLMGKQTLRVLGLGALIALCLRYCVWPIFARWAEFCCSRYGTRLERDMGISNIDYAEAFIIAIALTSFVIVLGVTLGIATIKAWYESSIKCDMKKRGKKQ